MKKIISFGIPCYNSAEYMDHCVESILAGSGYADDVQVIIVDDGSTKDNTFEKAKEWEDRYPHLVKAVHQENGGHGMAVLKGLEEAEGVYYKVVDSDDWIDAESLQELLRTLREF
ncbi:MAG: glycosyltransferase family A protein, partial [Coriobacteriales bacterium]|nr:glycosyltransferase family A protein [Coriobacteriales bacterium]